jgi:hypothetical protein
MSGPYVSACMPARAVQGVWFAKGASWTGVVTVKRLEVKE